MSRVSWWMSLVVCLLLASSTGEAAPETKSPRKPYTRNVAIVLYESVEVLDFAGPAEVFQAASGFGASGQEKAFKVYTVGRTKAPLTSQQFLKVVPEFSIEDAPRPDIVVIPGGGTQVVLQDAEFMKWISKAAGESELALTVCTGAMTLGKAGLLDGLDATTYFRSIDSLQKMAPKARIHHGRRFIDSGRIVTTAGVSAGIDGSLHVVARLLGKRVADETAQYMEYKWTPEPYLLTEYSLFNPSLDERGRAIQQAGVYAQDKNWKAAVDTYRELLKAQPGDANLWSQLGQTLTAMKEYDGAIDAYARAAESKDQRLLSLYNTACVYSLKADNDRALEYLGKALDAGLKSNWPLSDPDLEHVRKDPRFQKLATRFK
ncbi:DJ-1/PfpI family protein [Archangium lansingense]|uniref:DJ-1/PfpI family protein n=1 Tax=Archangium lansingense TaxID=2995310 RepID=UPI003B8190C0